MLNDTQRLRPDNVLADSIEGQTLGDSSKSDRSILVHAKNTKYRKDCSM